jgi:hypothetical protein
VDFAPSVTQKSRLSGLHEPKVRGFSLNHACSPINLLNMAPGAILYQIAEICAIFGKILYNYNIVTIQLPAGHTGLRANW